MVSGVIMSKSCGSCQHFTKWKNDRISGGLCELLDWRTNSDCGRKCPHHKRIPYERKKLKLDECEGDYE
jgi:hypothetical protein